MRAPSACSFPLSCRSSPMRPSTSPTDFFDTWPSKSPMFLGDFSPSLLSATSSRLTGPNGSSEIVMVCSQFCIVPTCYVENSMKCDVLVNSENTSPGGTCGHELPAPLASQVLAG